MGGVDQTVELPLCKWEALNSSSSPLATQKECNITIRENRIQD
jgi:hypothetical protein